MYVCTVCASLLLRRSKGDLNLSNKFYMCMPIEDEVHVLALGLNDVIAPKGITVIELVSRTNRIWMNMLQATLKRHKENTWFLFTAVLL